MRLDHLGILAKDLVDRPAVSQTLSLVAKELLTSGSPGQTPKANRQTSGADFNYSE